MEKVYITIIKGEEKTPPTGLRGDVLSRIETLARRKNRYQESVGAMLSLASLSACISLAWYAISQFQQSGFMTYFSLIFSDSKIVFSHFSDFLLSLVEITPLFTITGILLAGLLFLVSMQYVMEHMRTKTSYVFMS